MEEKSVRQWLDLLPEEIRERAIRNHAPKPTLMGKYERQHDALIVAFDWVESPEKFDFWDEWCDWLENPSQPKPTIAPACGWDQPKPERKPHQLDKGYFVECTPEERAEIIRVADECGVPVYGGSRASGEGWPNLAWDFHDCLISGFAGTKSDSPNLAWITLQEFTARMRGEYQSREAGEMVEEPKQEGESHSYWFEDPKPIDWDAFRRETAARIMAGMFADQYYDGRASEPFSNLPPENLAKAALQYTDALIEELQKPKP